ncbi:hypothetical protein [Rhodopseudomonas sp. RCAM05734]|uniref:hypothetical protein n=1 Tax=Rhodopseudomonas sp. RCAM05734 TaxID=3457549 RepID=UPI004043B49C
MADLKFASGVAETAVTFGATGGTGLGDIFLAGAIDSDHSTFAAKFADGEMMAVRVFGGGKWLEVEATYNAGANSLTRTVFRDSSTGSNIVLSGTMTVLHGWGAADARAAVRTDRASGALAALHGRCVLKKSGANLLLKPLDGNTIVINGVLCSIPDAGVTLAPPATSNTSYLIYAFMSFGTMTLEASTTAHATQAGTGIEIKSGDATRSLVGQARTVSSAWVDTDAQRFVISYFNRREIGGHSYFGANRSTTSTSYALVTSNDMLTEFLTWGDEAVDLKFSGEASNSVTGGQVSVSFGIDSTTVAEDVFASAQSVSGTFDIGPVAFSMTKSGLAEGYHGVNPLVKVSSGTATLNGSGAAGTRCTLYAKIRG